MTKEEAINILKTTRLFSGRANGKMVYAEALNMAIKALMAEDNQASCRQVTGKLDTISRADAIDVAREELDSGTYFDIPRRIEMLPSVQSEPSQVARDIATIIENEQDMRVMLAQPEITDCDYCHEDSDGYVTPLEKNCHAFVTYSPIDGWILSLKANGWHGEARIKFCPMCGRRLGGQNR